MIFINFLTKKACRTGQEVRAVRMKMKHSRQLDESYCEIHLTHGLFTKHKNIKIINLLLDTQGFIPIRFQATHLSSASFSSQSTYIVWYVPSVHLVHVTRACCYRGGFWESQNFHQSITSAS